jgi:hypothetical protein
MSVSGVKDIPTGVFGTSLKPAGSRFQAITVDPAEQVQACTSLDFNKTIERALEDLELSYELEFVKRVHFR